MHRKVSAFYITSDIKYKQVLRNEIDTAFLQCRVSYKSSDVSLDSVLTNLTLRVPFQSMNRTRLLYVKYLLTRVRNYETNTIDNGRLKTIFID